MPKPKRLAQNTPMPSHSRFLWRVTPPLVRGVGRAFFSLRVEREPDLPEPPFVVAANHYSHFDPPVIATVLNKPVRYLALDDLFEVNRFLDWLMLGYGAIPIPRYRLPITAIRVALARLEAGEIVGVFPEATRVSHWGALPPKRGAAWLALRAGVPLVPVAVIGTGRVFGLDNRFHRGQIRVVVGPAIQTGGGDANTLTDAWGEWMTSQIKRYPESEVEGPTRSYHVGR